MMAAAVVAMSYDLFFHDLFGTAAVVVDCGAAVDAASYQSADSDADAAE